MPQDQTPKTASLEARINALRARHSDLERAISDEERRPLPSMSRLRSLKSRKLMLKDEMTYYSGVLQTIGSFSPMSPQGAA